MEPQRGDGTATVFTHTLADGMFYFDNPSFRAREGDVVPFKDTTVTVGTRINFTNNVSPRFVGRDSPQVATRIANPACANPFVSRVRGPDVINHCGGVSQWSVNRRSDYAQLVGCEACFRSGLSIDIKNDRRAARRILYSVLDVHDRLSVFDLNSPKGVRDFRCIGRENIDVGRKQLNHNWLRPLRSGPRSCLAAPARIRRRATVLL